MLQHRYLFQAGSVALAVVFSILSPAQDKAEGSLEEARQLRDETVWANELKGDERWESILTLWSELRESETPWELLRTFPVERVEAPQFQAGRRLPEKIFEFVHTISDAGPKYFKSYQLQLLLNRFAEEGYSLDQVDFRHLSFDQDSGGKAVSRVEFEFNVSGARHTSYRRSFRGVARLQWGDEPDADGRYHPESISFESLRLYRRTGELVFKVRDWLEGGERHSPYQYALVEDFDLDGLPDVLFPLSNLLYRNIGDFRFDPKPFVKHIRPEPIDSALLIDLDLDGRREYVVCYRGSGLLAFEQHRKTGKYDQKPKTLWDAKRMLGARSLTAGDVDGDGLPDLLVGQMVEAYLGGILPNPIYDANDGFRSYLLLNKGKLKFKEANEDFPLAEKSLRRNKAASIVDLNEDGRMDIVLTNDYAGVDLYSGSDSAEMEAVGEGWLGDARMFGANHLVADFNGDGRLDFFAGGRNSEAARRLAASGGSRDGFSALEEARAEIAQGSRLWLGRGGAKFERVADVSGDFERGGWVVGSADVDFNNDGLLDIYLSNGYLSTESLKDYEDVFWRHDAYDGETESKAVLARHFRDNGPIAYIAEDKGSWAPRQKNRLLANFGEDGFIDIAYLLGVSREFDGRSVIAEDLNVDGKPDLILMESDAREETFSVKILENDMIQTGNWIGVQLRPAEKRSTAGARVRLIGDDFETVKTHLTGQAYGAQTSSLLRFGIGDSKKVKALEVYWADGAVTRIENPDINKYHPVAADQ